MHHFLSNKSKSPHKPNAGYQIIITKTRLYNFDPLKPHFYTVKLGFTGVYNIFLISAQNIDCGYSLEPPRGEAVLTSTHNLCFEQKYEKYQSFLSFIFIFSFLRVKFSIYLNRCVLVMADLKRSFSFFFMRLLSEDTCCYP